MKKIYACLCAFLFFLLGSFFALHALNAYAEEEKCIYLTFDDGPTDRVTPVILDVLNKKGVNATFFVIGQNIPIRKALTKRIAEEGNSVGIHTYSHIYKEIYCSKEALLSDIKKCSDELLALGIKTKLYRFPGGSGFAGKEYAEAVKEAGYNYIDWNALCGDSEFYMPTAYKLYRRAIETAKGKNKIIMLFHDSTDKSATAEALPGIIDYFKEKNYQFKTFPME